LNVQAVVQRIQDPGIPYIVQSLGSPVYIPYISTSISLPRFLLVPALANFKIPMATSNLGSAIKFCSECNNLLYSKCDVERRLLLFGCRRCGAEEPGDVTQVVYRNDMMRRTKEQSGIVHDLQTDPTLPHSSIPGIGPTGMTHCPNPAGCTNTDAVYFQDQSKRKHTRMILFYVCTKCNWVFGDPELEKGSGRGLVEKEEEEM